MADSDIVKTAFSGETAGPDCIVAIRLADGSIADDRTFTVESFSGHEAISELYEYTCTLKVAADRELREPAWPFSFFIGRPARIRLATRSPSINVFRSFSGVIGKCALAEPGAYSITIRPLLWLLTLTNKYHVYGNDSQLTLPEVIERVLQSHSIPFRFDIAENQLLKRRQNWLQAGETDFEFLTRMVDKADLFYYFEHTETQSILVLSNQNSFPHCRANAVPLRYVYTNEKDAGLAQDDIVTVYSFERNLVASTVKSTIIRSEASWEKEPPIGFRSYTAEKSFGDDKRIDYHHCKVLQFGVDGSLAVIDAEDKIGQLNSSATRLSGESANPEFKVGHRFSLSNKGRYFRLPGESGIREELNGKEFVVVGIEHSYSCSEGYKNQFNATEPVGSLVPFAMQNTLQGTLLGIVCPPPDNQDYRYLRTADFDWCDATSGGTEKDNIGMVGLWIRLATDGPSEKPVWIKLSQQMKTIPEKGSIVIVSRANDDSEMPEVQNVFDSNGSAAVTQPGHWMADTRVSNNYSVNYGDSKSVRYGKNSPVDLENDKALMEKMYATGKYKEVSCSKGASYNRSASDNGENGLLSESESYGKVVNTSRGDAVNKTYGVTHESYTELTTSNSVSKIGSQTNVSDIQSSKETSTIGSQTSNTTIQTQSSTSTITDQTNDTNVTNSTETSTIGTQVSTSTIGNRTSTSTVGNQTESSTIGHQSATNVTSSASAVNVVGATNEISVNGETSRLSVTGTSQEIAIAGQSSHVTINGAGTSTDISAAVVGIRLSGLNVDIVGQLNISM